METRVLLVDGEASVRRALRGALADARISAGECGDGLAALRAIDAEAKAGRPYAAAVVAQELPDIDGLKLLSVLKSRFPGLKVFVTSAPGTGELAATVTSRHGDAHLVKPIDGAAVARLVAGLRADATETPVTAKAAPAKAYAFLAMDRAASPWSVLADVASGEPVATCDPVRDGKWDAIALLRGASAAALEEAFRKRFKGVPGIVTAELAPVHAPKLDDGVRAFLDAYARDHAEEPMYCRGPGRATSYVFVDAAPQELANVYARLYLLDEVIEIDASEAEGRLVLLMQGCDFARIRRALVGRIRSTEGVSRVHEMKVVPTEAM